MTQLPTILTVVGNGDRTFTKEFSEAKPRFLRVTLAPKHGGIMSLVTKSGRPYRLPPSFRRAMLAGQSVGDRVGDDNQITDFQP